MKRFVCLGITSFVISIAIKAQDQGFYADGYLLYNKDTSWCKIWFDPSNYNFSDSLITWNKDEEKVIPLINNKELAGFGIIQKGYKMDFGKIRLQGLKSWVYTYTKKLVTGAVELYELPFTEMKKDPGSMKLLREEFAAYYIARTDKPTSDFPTQLKQLRKKKIAPFLPDYPELKEMNDVMTAEEVAGLIRRYNAWFKEKSPDK